MSRDVAPLPGYPEPYALLCAVLQDGTTEWRMELDQDLEPEAVVWQPHPGLHSVGGCLLHIAAVEVFWFEQYVLGLPRNEEETKILLDAETDVDSWQWPDPPREPISWYFDLHDRIRSRTLEGIKHWPAADQPIGFRDGNSRTPRWVFGHVIQHEAYHGGQAVLLQRLWELSR